MSADTENPINSTAYYTQISYSTCRHGRGGRGTVLKHPLLIYISRYLFNADLAWICTACNSHHATLDLSLFVFMWLNAVCERHCDLFCCFAFRSSRFCILCLVTVVTISCWLIPAKEVWINNMRRVRMISWCCKVRSVVHTDRLSKYIQYCAKVRMVWK